MAAGAVLQLGAEQLARTLAARHASAVGELRDLTRDLVERRALGDSLLGGQRGDAELILLRDLAVVAVVLVELDAPLRDATGASLVDHRLGQHGDLRLVGTRVDTDGRQQRAFGLQLAQLLAELALGVELDGHRGEGLDGLVGITQGGYPLSL